MAVNVLCLIRMMLCAGLQCVIVASAGHNHLLSFITVVTYLFFATANMYSLHNLNVS